MYLILRWLSLCVCVCVQTSTGKCNRADSTFSTKSHLSTSYRYRDGHLLNIVGSPVQESCRNLSRYEHHTCMRT